MHPTDRNRLRRLRILQQLQHAYPNPIGGPLLLVASDTTREVEVLDASAG